MSRFMFMCLLLVVVHSLHCSLDYQFYFPYFTVEINEEKKQDYLIGKVYFSRKA